MNTLTSNTKIVKLTFDEKIYVSLSSGDVLTIPFNYTKKLAQSTKEQLSSYRLIADGIGVHFDKIDEEIDEMVYELSGEEVSVLENIK